jgi:hypothetical protein
VNFIDAIWSKFFWGGVLLLLEWAKADMKWKPFPVGQYADPNLTLKLEPHTLCSPQAGLNRLFYNAYVQKGSLIWAKCSQVRVPKRPKIDSVVSKFRWI